MMILTGEFKGRKIHFRPHPTLRPSSDKLRKAIFDSLQGAVEGKTVLDLFSGTGALGLEALSSGAQSVLFVEKDAYAAGQIERNLKGLGLDSRGDVMNDEAIRTIVQFSQKKESYDLIFLDPPYRKGLVLSALRALDGSTLLHPGSLIIAECEKTEVLPDAWGTLQCVRDKTYGDARLLYYRLKTA